MTRFRATRGWLLPLVWLALLMMPAFFGVSAQTGQENRVENDGTGGAATDEDKGEETLSTSATGQRDQKQGNSEATATTHKGKVLETNRGNVSPLVKAAASSSKRKSVRSFTDADLDRAKGKIIIVEGTNVREPEIIPVEERSPEVLRPLTDEQVERARQTQSQAQNEAREKALRKEIADLENEVRRLEEDYYLVEEEDHREVIERSFAEKRRLLNEKRKQLSDLGSGGNS